MLYKATEHMSVKVVIETSYRYNEPAYVVYVNETWVGDTQTIEGAIALGQTALREVIEKAQTKTTVDAEWVAVIPELELQAIEFPSWPF